jgi:type II secretory pathway component PulL
MPARSIVPELSAQQGASISKNSLHGSMDNTSMIKQRARWRCVLLPALVLLAGPAAGLP